MRRRPRGPGVCGCWRSGRGELVLGWGTPLLDGGFCAVDLGLEEGLAVAEVEEEDGLVEAPGFPEAVVAADCAEMLGDKLEGGDGLFV